MELSVAPYGKGIGFLVYQAGLGNQTIEPE